MPRIPDDLAARMVEYRARNDLNQRELAERCSLTIQTVGNIENGRRNTATKLTLAKIEGVLSAGQ